ncbi:FKBP-type peptidyl-prolyl cis-trans isomerase [Raineya sp.]|jgi:FKBP-type peptidyl-prolyl cis-trans isomerase
MNRHQNLLTFFALILAFFACEKPRKNDKNEERLPSGVIFQILERNPKGEKLKEGEYAMIHLISKLDTFEVDNSYKRALLDSSLRNGFSIPVKGEKGLPTEVLPFLQIGDSVKIKVSLDTLVKKYPFFDQFAQEMQRQGKKNVYFEYWVKITGKKTKEQVQKDAQLAEQRQQENLKKKEAEEESKLEAYIKENKLEMQKTASGLYYKITKTAPENPQAKAYDTVYVHYTGKFLDGKVFDSSLNRKEPLQFVLGMGSVIKGWDEGIALLRKGEKAQLLIPSKLAYGAMGGGETIPPFSTLLFEVELIDIKPNKNLNQK